MNYHSLAPDFFIRQDGRLQLENCTVVPLVSGKWLYQLNNSATPDSLLKEVLQTLAEIGPNQQAYCLSLPHALVLYPQYIRASDWRRMTVEPILSKDMLYSHYWLRAELPFGAHLREVSVVINPCQIVPITIPE